MLTTRQIVPSTVAHIVHPFSLVDGSIAVLAAVGASIHAYKVEWEVDSGDEAPKCSFRTTGDEMYLGATAVAIAACAHQCFAVVTQDHRFMIARYQANLPTEPTSWLANDPMHHNNAWIILHRALLCATFPGPSSEPERVPHLACSIDGSIVQCSATGGRQHCFSINFPSDPLDAERLAQTKWAFDVPGSMAQQTCPVAAFRRDAWEQSDEELLEHYTIQELVQRKHGPQQPKPSIACGTPPVNVSTINYLWNGGVTSVACVSGTSSRVAWSEHTERRDIFAGASNDTNCLHLCTIGRPKLGQVSSGTYPMDPFSPYLVLSLDRMAFVLSRAGNTHTLSVFDINEFLLVEPRRIWRIARSKVQPIAGVVLHQQRTAASLGGANRARESSGSGVGAYIMWLLLSNGDLTEVAVGPSSRSVTPVVVEDVPRLLLGDCEEVDWMPSVISGIRLGFRPSALVSLPHGPAASPQTPDGERHYILLSDGVADTYVVDLESRRAVGALLSNGAMTSACGGPSADIIVSYAKGVLQRLSPGIRAPLRVRATLAGVRRVFLVSNEVGALLQGKQPQHDSIDFYVLVTTAVNSALLRGNVNQLEEVHEVQKVVVDEPTLAVYSAPVVRGRLPIMNHFFAQCTPTCINLSGERAKLSDVLPEFTNASHACFGDGEWCAVAYAQRVAVLNITNDHKFSSVLMEVLPSDVSHVTVWKVGDADITCFCGKACWGVAVCLWSREMRVWLIDRDDKGELKTRCHAFQLGAVALSSFLVSKEASDARGHLVHNVGVGHVLLDQTVAVLQCRAGDPPSISLLRNVNGGTFTADLCVTVEAHDTPAACRPHFDFATVCSGSVELVSLDDMSTSGEQLMLALAPHTGSNGTDGNEGMLLSQWHCGLAVYLPGPCFYLLLLGDSDGLTLRSITELVPPPQPFPLTFQPKSTIRGEALIATQDTSDDLRRRGVLLREPVVYQPTHSICLPSITSHLHSLTKVVYLPQCGVIAALLDRGEQSSFITTVDVSTFCVVDAISMKQNEVAMCMEPLRSSSDGEMCGDCIIGTVVLSSTPTKGVSGVKGDATAGTSEVVGRLVVIQARPLRVFTSANIVGPRSSDGGGAADISIQSLGNVHLVAVAAFDMVLVYRLVGDTLAPLCSAPCTLSCTTVALKYPFLSCGLYSWGTRYMQLVSKSSRGDAGKALGGVVCSEPTDRPDDLVVAHCLDDDMSLRQHAVEPTPFTNVHSQGTFADEFVRVDGDRNVVVFSLEGPKGAAPDDVTAANGVVGAEGGVRSSVTRCARFPSCIQRVALQHEYLQCHSQHSDDGNDDGNVDNDKSRLHGSNRACRGCNVPELTPWRLRRTPFVCWHGRPTALRVVGPSLLLPCADGALYCAREVPLAFAGVLLRLEQRATELYDTTFSLSRCGTRTALGEDPSCALQRTYHTVSFEAGMALQSPTRTLMKQCFVSVDAVGELLLLRRLVELPDAAVSSEERLLAKRKLSLLDERLEHVWAEYGGELQEVAIGELLYLW